MGNDQALAAIGTLGFLPGILISSLQHFPARTRNTNGHDYSIGSFAIRWKCRDAAFLTLGEAEGLFYCCMRNSSAASKKMALAWDLGPDKAKCALGSGDNQEAVFVIGRVKHIFSWSSAPRIAATLRLGDNSVPNSHSAR